MHNVVCRTIVVFFLAVLTGYAPITVAQDLLEIWTAALQRDPSYAAAQAGRRADQEVVPQARAQLLPYITADAAAQTTDIRRAAGLRQERTDREAVWALTLTQPIVDIGKWDQLKQSQYIAESADIAAKQAYQDLILRVSQAYFDVLAAHDTLRALNAQNAAATSQLQAARKAFELGSATVTDIYETQARLDLIHASEIQARNTLQNSEDELEKIISQRPRELARLVTDTTLPAPAPARLSDWTNQAAHANFTAARAQLTTRIIEKQIGIAKSEHYPRLSLYAQSGSASNRGVHGPDTQPRSLDSSVGLQLTIPIFAGGEISSRVREQTSRLQQARYEYEAAKRQAVQDTQQYFSGVTSGLAQIEVLKAAEKSSLASVDANQTAYEIGVRDNMDVLDAQQQLYETQRALAHTRYNTLMDSLRLKASSGILTQDDIVALNQLLDSNAPSPITP